MPGIVPIDDASITGIGDKHRRQWKPATPPFTVQPRLQPCFKLHGSSNWRTDDGRNLLVMGGNKDFMIREHAVLTWYYDQFRSFLARPDTRLMVIGYSFSDQHINDVIVGAWRNGTLQGMFLVDPTGRAVLNPTRALPIAVHSDLEDVPSLGGSTRTIDRIFGGDAFAHQEFMRFFYTLTWQGPSGSRLSSLRVFRAERHIGAFGRKRLVGQKGLEIGALLEGLHETVGV